MRFERSVVFKGSSQSWYSPKACVASASDLSPTCCNYCVAVVIRLWLSSSWSYGTMTCFGLVFVTFLGFLVVVSFLLGLWCSTPPMLAFAAEASGVGAQFPGALGGFLAIRPTARGAHHHPTLLFCSAACYSCISSPHCLNVGLACISRFWLAVSVFAVHSLSASICYTCSRTPPPLWGCPEALGRPVPLLSLPSPPLLLFTLVFSWSFLFAVTLSRLMFVHLLDVR